MDDLPVYAGFDRRILWALSPEDRNAFMIFSTVATASTAIVGLGALYGGTIATGSFLIGLFLAVGSVLVVANMYRLLHAGSGFPLHEPIVRLDTWKPGLASIGVLLALGVIMMQPVVLALMSVVHGKSGGLITQGLATWQYPVLAGLLTFLFASLMSASAWLRRFFLSSVRAYERERWIAHRMFVDDAYAEAQEIIHGHLDGTPGYRGMQQHFADPPYNTRPLLFGFDPELLERDGVRFIKPAKRIADERERLPEEEAQVGRPPPPAPPPSEQRPPEAPVAEDEEPTTPVQDDALLDDMQDAIDDADDAMARADDALKEEEREDEAQAQDEHQQAPAQQASEEEAPAEEPAPDAEGEAADDDEPPAGADGEDEDPFKAVRDDELLEDMQDAIDDAEKAIDQAEEALEEEERRQQEDEARRRREEEDATAQEEQPDEALPDHDPEEERADDAIDEADDLFGDDDDDDDDLPPPALHYLEVGRMLPPRARRHMDEVAPFIAALTHRNEAVVRGLIRVAPDTLPMHKLFSEWKSLRSILLHNAGFALDANMASIISIAVGRPTPDVLRRLKAAPRERRLAGVFAPELARKLLGRKI